jgi:hypothetical protein
MRKMIDLVESAHAELSFKQQLMTEAYRGSHFDDPVIKWALIAIITELGGIAFTTWVTCTITTALPVIGAIGLATFLGVEFIKTRNLFENEQAFDPAAIAMQVYNENNYATINDYARMLISMIESGEIREGSAEHVAIQHFNTMKLLNNILAKHNEHKIKEQYLEVYDEVKRIEQQQMPGRNQQQVM